jgi:hypothetical protein
MIRYSISPVSHIGDTPFVARGRCFSRNRFVAQPSRMPANMFVVSYNVFRITGPDYIRVWLGLFLLACRKIRVLDFRNSSGSFATLAAIRRALSLVRSLAAERRTGSSSY